MRQWWRKSIRKEEFLKWELDTPVEKAVALFCPVNLEYQKAINFINYKLSADMACAMRDGILASYRADSRLLIF
jgi:hypothetical protein